MLGPGAARARALAVQALLDRRARAVLHRDRAAFLATVDPAERGFFDQQSGAFRALERVPIASWSYQITGSAQLEADPPVLASYHAEVFIPAGLVLHYRIAGFDTEPTALVKYDTFVHRSAGWLLASESDFAAAGFPSSEDLWDFGPVLVVHGRRSLVLGHPREAALLRTLAREADRDVLRVTRVWGTGWARRVVILVPDTQTELAQILVDGGDLGQIAAVATAELSGLTGQVRPVGDRILINPPNFARLGPLGRQVVITHEITHVATRAATGPGAPDWLVEGFADYVGYLGTGVDARIAASELRSDLASGYRLGGLPGDVLFAGDAPRLAQSYEEAWLACRYTAARYGQEALVALYRTIGAAGGGEGRAVASGLAQVLHTTLSAYVTGWHDYVHVQLS